MRRVRPDLAVIRGHAENLKRALEKQFLHIEVEYADWLELLERVRQGEAPDVIELDFGADAYMWVRGEPKLAEKAVTFAENLDAELWQQSGVIIHIRARDTIWCRKTGRYDVRSLELEDGPLYALTDKRGVTFVCWADEPHEHEWGRLKLQE
ncbi:MAG: hypothetical protein HY689_09530 [Chloroflexi bacterium]|nr:hypothetical protein [Chloroflexota bacterium]